MCQSVGNSPTVSALKALSKADDRVGRLRCLAGGLDLPRIENARPFLIGSSVEYGT